MQEQLKAADIARDLYDRLGLDALVEASRRAEACRQGGDRAGVRWWNTIGRHVRLMVQKSDGDAADGRALSSGVTWRLMQRVEHFRHRAAQCRRGAEEAAEPLRSEMLEVEQHWLELAAYAEILAGSPGNLK